MSPDYRMQSDPKDYRLAQSAPSPEAERQRSLDYRALLADQLPPEVEQAPEDLWREFFLGLLWREVRQYLHQYRVTALEQLVQARSWDECQRRKGMLFGAEDLLEFFEGRLNEMTEKGASDENKQR